LKLKSFILKKSPNCYLGNAFLATASLTIPSATTSYSYGNYGKIDNNIESVENTFSKLLQFMLHAYISFIAVLFTIDKFTGLWTIIDKKMVLK
jgi:hypothetical protein